MPRVRRLRAGRRCAWRGAATSCAGACSAAVKFASTATWIRRAAAGAAMFVRASSSATPSARAAAVAHVATRGSTSAMAAAWTYRGIPITAASATTPVRPVGFARLACAPIRVPPGSSRAVGRVSIRASVRCTAGVAACGVRLPRTARRPAWRGPAVSPATRGSPTALARVSTRTSTRRIAAAAGTRVTRRPKARRLALVQSVPTRATRASLDARTDAST